MGLLGPRWDIQYPTFRIHELEPRSRVGADPSLALLVLEAVERAISPQQIPGLYVGPLNGLDDAGVVCPDSGVCGTVRATSVPHRRNR